MEIVGEIGWFGLILGIGGIEIAFSERYRIDGLGVREGIMGCSRV